MQNLLPLRMLPLLSAAILIVLALTLSGCASPSSVACEEPKPLPKTLTEPSFAACTKLLRESVDLLSEGRSLALEIGAKHDAVSTLQKVKEPRL